MSTACWRFISAARRCLNVPDASSFTVLALSAVYAEQGLCNGTVSVRLFVCPSVRPVRAAGLLL